MIYQQHLVYAKHFRPHSKKQRTFGEACATGALWKADAPPRAVWCNAMCCTWARSTKPKRRRGARPSRCSARAVRTRRNSPCSPTTGMRRRWTATWCRSGLATYNFAGHGNGAHAGSPATCGTCCGLTISGPTSCRRHAKARAG